MHLRVAKTDEMQGMSKEQQAKGRNNLSSMDSVDLLTNP